MRFGAIPFHLWAARLTDVVPETRSRPDRDRAGVAGGRAPGVGRSAVAPVAVDLTPERYIVLTIAVATILLAAVAAFVQDDLEHVLGYSIVATPASSSSPSPSSARRAAPRSDMDPRVHRRRGRVRGLGGRDPGRASSRAASPTCAAGHADRPLLPGRVARGGCRQHRLPGLASFDRGRPGRLAVHSRSARCS
jgi:hypothetical protein